MAFYEQFVARIYFSADYYFPLGTCHYLAGGRVIIFFPLVWGRVTIFLSIFIEKINYEYPAAAGFRFLLILPLPSKKKCPEGRNKMIYMNLDVRYCILKEGQTDRRILLFRCYV